MAGILLVGTSDKIKVVTSAATNVDVSLSYIDFSSGTSSPGRALTLITSNTTTDVSGSPASSTARNVKTICLRNRSATTSNQITFIHTDGTNNVELHSENVGPLGEVMFMEGYGFVTRYPTLNVQNWQGNVCAAYGNGDPNIGWALMTQTGSLAATPTAITATVARISYFRLPANLVVNKVRYYGVGAVTSIYGIAIYDGVTLARLSAYTTFTTAAATWGSIYSALALTLNAGQLYFLAVSANTTGATAGIASIGTTVSASTGGQEGVLPSSAPGNLSLGSGYLLNRMAQGAVTAGALPDPFPTVALQSVWTGGMPLFFLDNSNA